MAPFQGGPKSVLKDNFSKSLGGAETVIRFRKDAVSCTLKPKRITDAPCDLLSVDRRFGFDNKCSQ